MTSVALEVTQQFGLLLGIVGIGSRIMIRFSGLEHGVNDARKLMCSRYVGYRRAKPCPHVLNQLDIIVIESTVFGQQCHPLAHRLSNYDAIEWISMVIGETVQHVEVLRGDRQ